MNKDMLIRKYAEVTGQTLKDARIAVDGVIDSAKTLLKEEGKVGVVGFGSMELVDVAEAEKRNPSNGETVLVPAHKKIKVKVSDTLKKELRNI